MTSNHQFKTIYILIITSCHITMGLYLECQWSIPFNCDLESYITDFSNTTALTIKKVDFAAAPLRNSVTFKTVDEFRTIFSSTQDVKILNITETLLYTKNFLLFQRMANINISWSKIQTLDKTIWADSNTVKSIDLSFGRVSVVLDNAFSRCKLLQKIYLNNNFLTLIRDKTFAGIPKIEEIFLNSNLIGTVESNAFNIPHLERLYLQNNQLVVLSDGLFSNAPKYLDVSSNQLKNIGGAFDDAIKLTSLIMNNNTELHKVNLNALAELYNLNEISLNGTGFYFHERVPSNIYYGTVRRRHSIVKHLNLLNDKYMVFNNDQDRSTLLMVLSTVFPFLETLRINVDMSVLELAYYFPAIYNISSSYTEITPSAIYKSTKISNYTVINHS